MSVSSDVLASRSSIVENVPADVWIEIFRCIHHSTGVESHFEERDETRRSIISASHTCSTWRDITIQTPYLWTTILVDFDTSTPSGNLNLTYLWLERSQNTPLSIILLHIPDGDVDPPQNQECLVAVFSAITRWKDALISWRTTTSDIWYSVDVFMDYAPLLESLVIETKHYGETDGHELIPWKIWHNSPRLRKLAILVQLGDWYWQAPSQISNTAWPSEFHIPYRRLTHLRLESNPDEAFHRDQVLSIFTAAPNLVTCFIEGIENELVDPVPFNRIGIITLKRLRHLYLESSETILSLTRAVVSLSGLLSYITASSALVTLTVVGDRNWQFNAYKNFILRSSCVLEELNLVKTHLSIGDIFPTMELSPTLRAVNFDTFLIDNSSLELWTAWDPVEDSFQLCPHLQQLSISGSAHLALTWPPVARGLSTPARSTLTRALAARIHPVTGVSRTFTFLIPFSNAQYVPQGLRDLCDQPSGLKIGFNDHIFSRGTLWDLYANL